MVNEVKIISYNVHSCVGSDGMFSVDRISNVLAAECPDIVCLQEIESNQSQQRTRLWSSAHSIDQPRAIASQLNGSGDDGAGFEHIHFAPAISSVATSVVNEAHDVSYAKGQFGIATISKYPMLETRVHRYARYHRKTLRNAQACLIQLPNGADSCKVWVVNTHLGCHHGTEQYAQAVELVRFMHSLGDGSGSGYTTPVILCGDLNSPPFFKSLGLIKREGFEDTWKLGGVGMSSRGCTFPSDGRVPGLPSLCSVLCRSSPFLRLDYIFLKRGGDSNDERGGGHLSLRCAYVIRGGTSSNDVVLASDHLPICSVFGMNS